MEQDQKIGFFKRIVYSIKDFEKYQEFALENKLLSIKYIMKLILILSIVISICFMSNVIETVKEGIRYFRNDFPNLHFSNNELVVESDTPIIHDFSEKYNISIVIDSMSLNEEIDYKEKLDLYENCIILGKDSITLKSVRGIKTHNYSSIVDLYGIQDFTKQDVESYLTNKNVLTFYLYVFIMMLLYTYMIYIITTLLDAVLLAIFGLLSSRISRVNLKFSVIYKMSLYALTLPIILNIIYVIINSVTGFVIENFDWMYTAISFIYLITAILMIKSDMIKQQMELLKIEEERKKIIEEQMRKEEEERQKQEQKRREKEEKKKKDGEKKQDPAPEGT